MQQTLILRQTLVLDPTRTELALGLSFAFVCSRTFVALYSTSYIRSLGQFEERLPFIPRSMEGSLNPRESRMREEVDYEGWKSVTTGEYHAS